MKKSLKGFALKSSCSSVLKLCAIALFANLCGVFFATADEAAPPTAGQLEFFENKVRPLLVDKCYRFRREHRSFKPVIKAEPPGGDSKDHWPTLCLNTLRRAKKQGAEVGRLRRRISRPMAKYAR